MLSGQRDLRRSGAALAQGGGKKRDGTCRDVEGKFPTHRFPVAELPCAGGERSVTLLIGAPSGLGYAVEWYRELLMTPQVMAFIAMIGVLGYLTDTSLRALAKKFTPWAVDARAV